MSRLCIESRGICNWRDRLASPETQWKRTASAFETAVSWELAERDRGLPRPIADLFGESAFGAAELGIAIAEHKVALAGRGGDSQCDVWALVSTSIGLVSLSVEAKAQEGFGNGHQSLSAWLAGGDSARSAANRSRRWQDLVKQLPTPVGTYDDVAFQLLHRCGAAVLEARRLHIKHAAFVVQAFKAPETSFQAFCRFGIAIGLPLQRNRFVAARVPASEGDAGDIALVIGWADCPLATDVEVAAVVS